MTREEATNLMKKGAPVVWNGRGTSVQTNITYAFIVSVNETFDRKKKQSVITVTLADKNNNSQLTALAADLRRATLEEIMKFHGIPFTP